MSSAYAFFFKETQASVKTHNPGAKFGEVSKIVASMWEALGEEGKAAYRERNEEDKRRFERENRLYRARLESGEIQPPQEGAAPAKKRASKVSYSRETHASVTRKV